MTNYKPLKNHRLGNRYITSYSYIMTFFQTKMPVEKNFKIKKKRIGRKKFDFLARATHECPQKKFSSFGPSVYYQNSIFFLSKFVFKTSL